MTESLLKKVRKDVVGVYQKSALGIFKVLFLVFQPINSDQKYTFMKVFGLIIIMIIRGLIRGQAWPEVPDREAIEGPVSRWGVWESGGYLRQFIGFVIVFVVGVSWHPLDC